MLLQIQSQVLIAKPALCSAAARRQVTVQAAHLDHGSRNLDVVASRFKLRLQGASRQVQSRLDGAEAQQDALASQLDILESKWVNSLAISFMALDLAMAAASTPGSSLLPGALVSHYMNLPAEFGSFLPALLLCPFMLWAAVSRWVTSGDLTRACTHANWDLETAEAEGLADLEACQSQAMDDLAGLQLPELRRDAADSSGVQAGRDSTAKQQIVSEVEAVQKRVERRLKLLQVRQKHLLARKDKLSDVWGKLSLGTCVGMLIVLLASFSAAQLGDKHTLIWSPAVLFLYFMITWWVRPRYE